MRTLFRSSKNYRWWPDADAVNAPEGVLLRADNLVPDAEAMLTLRLGSNLIYSGMQTRVHSLYTAVLAGLTHRFAGCDNRLYHNGVDFGANFSGAGDMAFGDDAYQMFCARSTTKKKFDGTNFNEWPVKAPELKATLTAVPAITATIASFDSAESPAFVINEGTSAFVTGSDGVTANGALKLTPDAASGRASASKKFSSDQNFFDILGATGGDTDLFDMYVWIEEPNKVDRIQIMFGLGTGTDPYKDDYYYFDFKIKDAGTVDIKDSAAASAQAYAAYATKVQQVLTPNEITDIKRPEQIAAVLKRLGRFAGPRSRERKDSLEASPAWTHLSVTRGQMNRVGGTAGRDWKTIRGFKVVYVGQAGSTKVVQFDSAVMTGGGNRSLTGRYKLGYRFVRNFNDTYFELSPISPISDPIDLTQQSLSVTIPAAALSGKDPQVNQIWVYLIGGFLDTYYRFAIVSAFIQQGMTIDELTNPAGSNFQTKGERTRLTSWGFTRITGGDAVASDLVFSIRKSELEALTENEMLEPGCVGPPDNIVAIAGPYNGRMFAVTLEGRAYPSSQDNPSSFSLYHHLDLRRYGTPLWAILTNSGLYIGMTKDIVHIGGSGDESDDHVSVDLFPEPLHTGNPPVDKAAVTDGNSILYRSADGPMLLTGATFSPIPFAGTGTLWKGIDRHGVSALNTAYGRFRFAVDNHVLYMLAPEGPSYTPPIALPEAVDWTNLVGLTFTNGVLTKTAATGFGNTNAVGTKILYSSDGYVEATAIETNLGRILGLTTGVECAGTFALMPFAMGLRSDGGVSIIENGVTLQVLPDAYTAGEKIRIEVQGGKVYYKRNGVVVYTSLNKPVYPLVADTAFNHQNSTLKDVTVGGNWMLKLDGSSILWRYSLLKQQWSRTTHPFNIESLFRDPNGSLIAGTDDGRLFELEVGRQDKTSSSVGADIAVSVLTPVDDGGNPLMRKDPQDLQIHADTGGGTGMASFFLDGSSTIKTSFNFSTLIPDIFRINALALGAFLKAQVRIDGVFNRFLLHAFGLTYRERVQEVMVLDTGTISPVGNNKMVWLTEAEIDCISPANLVADVYLNDILKASLPIIVRVGKRDAYRFELPRGCKSTAPRMVFRTTNPNGVGDLGFEPYRVRVRDRGTGTVSDNEFRPIWPIGQAP